MYEKDNEVKTPNAARFRYLRPAQHGSFNYSKCGKVKIAFRLVNVLIQSARRIKNIKKCRKTIRSMRLN